MSNAVRVKLKELEPLRSVYNIEPLERRIGDAFAQNRLRTVLLTLFATIALGLACLGVYGTLSYAVTLRRREIGLRLALGAQHSTIILHFLKKVLLIVGSACVAGLALSLAFSRALSSMLYEVAPFDPATLFTVITLVLAVAIVAALLPTLRAAVMEPMQALRE